MSELGQGLSISGIGILITFSALGILIGLIILLKALFPVRDEESGTGEKTLDSSPPKSLEREQLLKQAAAAGVSVLTQKKTRSGQGSLGDLLEDPVSGWWQRGLDRAQGKE